MPSTILHIQWISEMCFNDLHFNAYSKWFIDNNNESHIFKRIASENHLYILLHNLKHLYTSEKSVRIIKFLFNIQKEKCLNSNAFEQQCLQKSIHQKVIHNKTAKMKDIMNIMILMIALPIFFQVLHVIDDILLPLTATPSYSGELNNPDGMQFLSTSDNLEIGGHRLRWVFNKCLWLCIFYYFFSYLYAIVHASLDIQLSKPQVVLNPFIFYVQLNFSCGGNGGS